MKSFKKQCQKPVFTLFVIFLLAIGVSFVPAKQKNIVIISTKYGDIKIRLYDETPKHRDNFLKITKEGFFDGLLFHRVIKNFVVQGGDPDSKKATTGMLLGNGGPGYDIPSEINPELKHKRGAVGAARESDDVNPERKSSGSQFYIVVGKKFSDEDMNKVELKYKRKFSEKDRELYKTTGGTPHLDGNYTVFGEVIEGMDIVDKISIVATDSNDRPVEDIKMTIKIN